MVEKERVALAECRYISSLWDLDFLGAAKALSDVSDDAGRVSENLKAWHALWLGYALDRAGDQDEAQSYYRSAHAIQRNIPRFQPPNSASDSGILPQVQRVADQMEMNHTPIRLPKKFKENLSALDGGTSNQVEESLRYLGQYLGFTSSRPDNEYKRGPDVLWVMDDLFAVCIEAKTNKKDTSQYGKEDIGQMHNHMQWVRENDDTKTIENVVPIFVGPKQGSTAKANPGDDMLVAEIPSFKALADRLEAVLRDVAEKALPISLRANAEEAMQKDGLLGRDVLTFLNAARIKDLGSGR